MRELADRDRGKVLDVLLERLTFERTGVLLYDAIIKKVRASSDEEMMRMLAPLQRHRDEEAEHVSWLSDQIRALGGDDQARSDRADLVERESQGFGNVILDGDPRLSHLFHALYAAELVDNAGWDLLVQIADEAGDKDAKRGFKRRLHDEEEHLVFVRRAVERFARREILGEEGVRMPAWP